MNALLVKSLGRIHAAIAAFLMCVGVAAWADELRTTKITVTIDRGRDLGQCFGSLFEATSDDGLLVVGAGFPNYYNTRYRGDRHAVQFYIRPTSGHLPFKAETLPRPNDSCGTYLFVRDGVVRSTFGGIKAWIPDANHWQDERSIGGTGETMRIAAGLLEFGNSKVMYSGRTILDPPDKGTYQLFFYADGHLCFYHVNRGDDGYRPYQNDENGFSKLYACPWSSDDAAVDLSRAAVLTLPVVGETTFAWGQLGRQIVTGSNIGGFYVLEDGMWNMLLKPKLGVSNLWGQRVTSLVSNGPHLFVSTSAKFPCAWNAQQFSFLAPDKWKSYGTVYRLTMPGHLGATTNWTDGPTSIEFTIRGVDISIAQDGEQLATTTIASPLRDRLRALWALKHVKWGEGIYGRFDGEAIEGALTTTIAE